MKSAKNPLFSVVTPTYNSEKTIERTIKSVLNQTCKDFEYIIIDGKSTDNTLTIIEKYRHAFGNNLRVISESDNGIYDAMNKGIRLAKGSVIGIVNSDDFYEQDALESISKKYNKSTKYQIFYGFERILSDGKEKAIVFYNHNYLDQKMITHPTCFISKDVYQKLGLYKTCFKSSADYEFMLRLAHSKYNIVFIPIYKIISNFEEGGTSSTEIGVRETARLRNKYQIISKKKYFLVIIKSRLHDLFYR